MAWAKRTVHQCPTHGAVPTIECRTCTIASLSNKLEDPEEQHSEEIRKLRDQIDRLNPTSGGYL
jgi:hypothetical protein